MTDLERQLVITMEECGELVQACSKIIRTGACSGSRLDNLIEEAGDVYCMISILSKRGLFTQEDLEKQKAKRIEKLKKYECSRVAGQ